MRIVERPFERVFPDNTASDFPLEFLKLNQLAQKIRVNVLENFFYYGANPLKSDDLKIFISSIDQIYFTEGLLQSFLNNDEPEGFFAASLRKFGVVQALVVQQDAVEHLYKVLCGKEFERKNYSKLREIRELRNRYAGHPVCDTNKSRFVLSAVSHKNEVSFLEYGTEPLQIVTYNLCEVIDKQLSELQKILKEIENLIMQKEQNFREQLENDQPLNQVIKSNFQDIVSKSHPEETKILGQINFAKQLDSKINEFENAFKKVGYFKEKKVEYVISNMKHAASRVVEFYETYIKSNNSQVLNEKDVTIFLSFLDYSYDELVKFSEEIIDKISQKSCS
jgi:hypothetical protein